MNKEEIEKRSRKLRLVVRQEITHLNALTQIPAIKDNHNILSSLDLSIFKLWDALGGKQE